MSKFIHDIDLNKNELQNAVVQNLSSAPASPKEGQIYYNTEDKNTYRYNPILSFSVFSILTNKSINRTSDFIYHKNTLYLINR